MRLTHWAGATAVAVAVLVGSAQTGAQTRSLRAMLARPTVEQAIADAYGVAMTNEMARLLAEQADPSCRKSRKLDDAAFARRTKEIYLIYGAKLAARQAARVDEEGLSARLNAFAGEGSAAALLALADQQKIGQLQRFYQHVSMTILPTEFSSSSKDT